MLFLADRIDRYKNRNREGVDSQAFQVWRLDHKEDQQLRSVVAGQISMDDDAI